MEKYSRQFHFIHPYHVRCTFSPMRECGKLYKLSTMTANRMNDFINNYRRLFRTRQTFFSCIVIYLHVLDRRVPSASGRGRIKYNGKITIVVVHSQMFNLREWAFGFPAFRLRVCINKFIDCRVRHKFDGLKRIRAASRNVSLLASQFNKISTTKTTFINI